MDKLFNILEAEKVDFIVCGDKNVKVLKSNHCLTDVLCAHGLKNVVSKPMCFRNRVAPTFTCRSCNYKCSQLVGDVISEQAPLKRKFIRGKQAPYMNSELRKAINVKNMLRRGYNNIKSGENWVGKVQEAEE